MAKLKVVKNLYPGWKIGDEVEAFGDRLDEIVSMDGVVVLEPDVEDEKPVEVQVVEEPKKRGRPKKV